MLIFISLIHLTIKLIFRLFNNFLRIELIFNELLNNILEINWGIAFNFLLLFALLEILIHTKLPHDLRIVLIVLHRHTSLPRFFVLDIKFKTLIFLTFRFVFEKRLIFGCFLNSLEKLLFDTQILVLFNVIETIKQ